MGGLRNACVGFVCGSLLGWASDTLTLHGLLLFWPCAFLSGLSLYFRRKRLSQIFLLVAGFLWGASHSAPYARVPLDDVCVVLTNVLPTQTSLIVNTGERFYRVEGAGHLLSHGQIKINPVHHIFGAWGARFLPDHYEEAAGITKLSGSVRKFLEKRIEQVGSRFQAFTESIIIGQRDALTPSLREDFRQLGIYHLLVVSGLHVSFLSWLMLICLFSPFQMLYAFCLLNPRQWFLLQTVLRLASLSVIFVFAMAIGFPSSAQRAVLLFACDQVAKVFALPMTFSKKVLVTLFMQQVLFPLDVVSLASLLSWMAFLSVASLVVGEKGCLKHLEVQFCLCLLVGGTIGQLSIAGLVLNLLVVPLFPLVVFSAVLQILPFAPVRELSARMLEAFLSFIEKGSEWAREFPFSYFDLGASSTLRWIALCGGSLFFLNILRRVTIASEADATRNEGLP